MKKFYQNHIINIMENCFPSKDVIHPLPLDRFLHNYWKENKSVGSKERQQITQNVYKMVRYQYLLRYLLKGKHSYEEQLNILGTSDFYLAIQNTKLPKYLRTSYPKELYDKIVESLGNEDKAFETCKIMNARSPLTFRFNPIKTNQRKILNMFENYLKVRAQPTQYSPFGIVVKQRISPAKIFQTNEFKNGQLQIQDQGSQLTALLAKCQPGSLVLDYCAGSGGKSLAIAHLLKGKGQIFLHDIREQALQNAKKRFLKSGAQNVQFHNNEQKLGNIINKIDWLILDLPCTGVGTIRRNPDLKLKFTEKWLKQCTILQESIFNKAYKYLNKNGKIVYITCSLLRQQNQEQVKKFIKNYNLRVHNDEILKIIPERDGPDGFFAVVLEKNV